MELQTTERERYRNAEREHHLGQRLGWQLLRRTAASISVFCSIRHRSSSIIFIDGSASAASSSSSASFVVVVGGRVGHVGGDVLQKFGAELRDALAVAPLRLDHAGRLNAC